MFKRSNIEAPENVLHLYFEYQLAPGSQEYISEEYSMQKQVLYFYKEGVYRSYELVRLNEWFGMDNSYRYVPREEVYITFDENALRDANERIRWLGTIERRRGLPEGIELKPSYPPPPPETLFV